MAPVLQGARLTLAFQGARVALAFQGARVVRCFQGARPAIAIPFNPTKITHSGSSPLQPSWQHPVPAGAFSPFPTAAAAASFSFQMPQAVPAPARPFLLYFPPTAAAMPAPAGATFSYRCHSSARSHWSLINFSPRPQQKPFPHCRTPLPQVPYQYLPAAAAAPAPAGALFSVFSPLPCQCLLQQAPVSLLPTATPVRTSTEASFSFRCHSGTDTTMPVQHPSALS
ncbi:hypothetical protein ROHU_025944 [Labeo rohita]|uniref:Uncharacterized protein n=1 Tax=Labeo rohita TaxID=84645 RepID=A0A498MCU2_LABRO|nr:hypothetical protein ROHU_025944 [Labeo rohita]